MGAINSFKDLEVWGKNFSLVSTIYQITQEYPKEEICGLTSQIRRSSVSIPSNIAEGWNRKSTKTYIQFLNIANGSLAELETLLIVSKNLNYLNEKNLETILPKVYENRENVEWSAHKLKASEAASIAVT